ncbi:hypothetical protein O3Q51_05855 [Cryomorphaceae bacterium 1068]|nr:hypothetical protein [Cryomorphaceae bacterium 1068]
MKSVLLALLFISSLAVGQNAAIPFELERFKEYPMIDKEVSDNLEDMTAGELLLVFHAEYKRIRAKKPSHYFPELSDLQKEIKDLIESKYPDHEANALVQFLESGCIKENLQNLISHPAEIKVLLPYQFMAAFALEETKMEKTYIDAMLREGMFSDVLKTWGELAVKSSDGLESIMTNGMQDLLAVRYAQQIKNISPDMMVANKFVQKCGLSEEASAFGRLWFAPTLEKNVISPFSARLKVVGIGFAFESPAGSNLMKQTAIRILQGSVSQTPADQGLVSSYGYLQKALAEAGIITEAEQLKKYIDKEGM